MTGRPDEVALAMARAGRTLYVAALATKCAGYGVLLALALGGPPRTALLAGVLVADVTTWALAALPRLRREPLHVVVDIGLYLAVAHLWLRAGGGMAVPEDPEGRGVAMLGFLVTFAFKGGALAWRLLHRDPRA